MSYVNPFVLPTISTNEIIPLEVTFTDFPSSGNTVITALRFNIANPTDLGMSVTSVVTISANVVTVANLWISGDTPVVGQYRIQLVVGNGQTPVTQLEINLLYTVI